MRVALIGSGGREHAIAYQLIDSDQLEKLYIFFPVILELHSLVKILI